LLLALGIEAKDIGHLPLIMSYMKKLEIFSHCLVRTAILRGGILWRLACEKLQNLGDACEVVLEGPTEMAHFTGQRFGINGLQFSDDRLLEEEEGLICEVYKVQTGENILFTNLCVLPNPIIENTTWKDQASEMSWWPKPSAWDNGGLNVGFWSPNCESWYQRRLQSIREGKATGL
jgi:hypothetical protein